MLLLTIPVMVYYKQHPWQDVPAGNYKYVCMLTCFGLANFFTFMYTTRLLPLLILSLVGNLAPFWASILGYAVNGDRVLCVEFGAMVFCFMCIAGMALAKSDQNGPEAITGNTYEKLGLGVSLAVLVTWFRAAQWVTNRRLKAVHFTVILFWYSLMGATLTFIGLLCQKLITKEQFFPYSATAWKWMFVAGSFDFCTCMAVFIAYQSDSSGFVSLIA